MTSVLLFGWDDGRFLISLRTRLWFFSPSAYHNVCHSAVIVIGVLIRGEPCTLSFPPVGASNSASVPIFLTEYRALVNTGIGEGGKEGRSHGVDWGLPTVEVAMSSERRNEGKFQRSQPHNWECTGAVSCKGSVQKRIPQFALRAARAFWCREG